MAIIKNSATATNFQAAYRTGSGKLRIVMFASLGDMNDAGMLAIGLQHPCIGFLCSVLEVR